MKTQLTRSQQKVYRLLQDLNRAIAAQDLYIELRHQGQNLGLATVYRALETLKLKGKVQVRTLPSGESLYSCLQQDKHYFTCVNCGDSIEIEECPVHQLEQELQQSGQFKIFYHTLEFFGLCDRCQSESMVAT
jgi:Fur family ferric uptake transcriptional regulator